MGVFGLICFAIILKTDTLKRRHTHQPLKMWFLDSGGLKSCHSIKISILKNLTQKHNFLYHTEIKKKKHAFLISKIVLNQDFLSKFLKQKTNVFENASKLNVCIAWTIFELRIFGPISGSPCSTSCFLIYIKIFQHKKLAVLYFFFEKVMKGDSTHKQITTSLD